MSLLRLISRRNRLLMVLFTLSALLFVQVLLLHTHTPHHHHDHTGHAAVMDHHEHLGEIHLLTASPADDSHDLASEIDPTTSTTTKNLTLGNPLLAILTLLILPLIPLLQTHLRWRTDRDTPFNSRALLIRPPLRAPPL